MEAQRRFRVDEELRLTDLRAHVSGPYSSSVLVVVGLISGFKISTESLTLLTLLTSVEGTLEVILSVSVTTTTTIDVFGATKAYSSLPDPES